jgi:hypothetical protein
MFPFHAGLRLTQFWKPQYTDQSSQLKAKHVLYSVIK